MYHWKMKLRAILVLGGKCVICGEDDLRILTVNHLNGHTGPRSGPWGIWRDSISLYARIANGSVSRNNLEVRCNNCNQVYEYERGMKYFPPGLPTSVQDVAIAVKRPN